ncbi:MAG: hypothetical protein NTX57_09020 [Armatimonadetes bacterium]|nr:hypothetical protein [Armatimonadota bacterium]
MSIVLELTPAEEEAVSLGAKRAGMELPAFLIACTLKSIKREEATHAETVAFLTEEARRAVAEAQNKLREKGIGYATGDETSVQKHLPPTTENV